MMSNLKAIASWKNWDRGAWARYKALQTKLDRVVAVKILSHTRSGDDRAVARFEREMKAVGRFDHPHIVRAYDARERAGVPPVLIMEFVEGMDLGQLVRRLGPLPVADAASSPAIRPSDCSTSTSKDLSIAI